MTTPVRTAYDLARREDLPWSVVAVDALAGRFGFRAAEVLEFARRYPGARGVRRLPGVVALSDPRAESAMETRLRLLLVRGGLPAPAVGYPVADDRARIVATVDLAYPEALVAIEYEARSTSPTAGYCATGGATPAWPIWAGGSTATSART